MSPRTATTSPADDLAIGVQPSQPTADTRALHQLQRVLDHGERPFLGFPDHLLQVMVELAPLLGLLDDQQGDPYEGGRFEEGTHAYKQAVLDYFAVLAGGSLNETHGHVASSPREALQSALVLARRRLPEPSAYVSEEAHRDVTRVCELLGMNVVRIHALPDGTMDPDDLRLQTRLRRGAGALVVATCGTPMRGAIDNIVDLRTAASSSGPVHVHVDASAGGLAAAHSSQVPPWSLAHGANSLTLSGHPLLSLPVPTGICLVRREHAPADDRQNAVPLRSPLTDTRSGLGALLLWTRLRSLGRTGVAAMVARGQDVAAHALEQLDSAGASPQHLPGSLTVTFEQPPTWVSDKWRLRSEGGLARITTTGPMTHAAVEELAADLRSARRGAAA
ncbi:pyridoxal-dependent decarboxylase (plasmid) [Streptomyces microflavus]|uniref:pyridoxal-dependent decarboxylase n=1 Tax=Streptomyces microflavus TaxID=1919 RepID=UPI002E126A67|nr:pyridoxal-dependent decarboxylase [Streptomyces microflavus]WSR96311.1 pyridoxal-dependent decarboxylase [Streptomyces microflavus]WSR96577.1 pyridoxal-dependent decarboxylase [Streptomyces microflavus]